MRFNKCIAPAALLLLLAGQLLAQVTTARLEGTVQDATGARVPGAKVELVNVKTQVRAEISTDPEGRFVFASVAPGEYTLSVEAGGFRKAVRQNLVLNVAETVQEDVKLEVGAVTDSVVVEANAVRVQTTDAQVARAVTLRDIENLPQLGRAPITLAYLNPGIQIDPSDASYSRVNGTRQGSSNAMLDGIEVNDVVAPRLGLTMTPTTSDTVEEFRVVTNGGKAEYGRSAGGQVQMITRGGTNEFHGGAWDYLRNKQLNANSFSNNYSGQPRPMYIRNIFGGRFEGPIKKDRTFFFGSYEGNRTNQQVTRNRTVLTPLAKQGIFRWNPSGGGAVQSYDVVKNDPRAKGIDAGVKNLLGLLPDPNNTDLGDSLNTAGYRFNAPANSYNDQFTVKVDHNVWNGHRAFFRYSWMRTSSIDTTNSQEARFPGDVNGVQGGHRAGWAAGSDWTLSSTVINEFRVGGQKSNSDFLRARLHETMIVPNLYTSPIADPTSFAQGRTVPYTEITDNVSKVLGKHTLKAGINARLTTYQGWREDYIWPTVYLATSNGNTVPTSVVLGGIATADRTRFDNFYNDILGRTSRVLLRFYSDLDKYQPAGTGRNREIRTREYAGFLQDDWKVNRRLTLNLGLRYELFGVPIENNGLQGAFDQVGLLGLGYQSTNLTIQKDKPYYNSDYNNFAPRVGFAWDIFGDGKTAVRGGFGTFYDRMITSAVTSVDTSTPGFSTDMNNYPNSGGTDKRYAEGIPAISQPSNPILQVPAERGSSVVAMNPNLRTGYVLHANLSIQREIFRNTVLEAGYVATRGIKLFMHDNLNQPRIYQDFLGAFKQLQAYRANKTPVPASNTLVRIFGSADSAVSAIGASTIDAGSVSSAAATVDNTYYTRYAAAGLPQTYLRNYPQFTYLYLGTNDGRSYYNSLQATLRRQVGAFKFNANYTFSKAMDNWYAEGNGTDSAGAIDWSNLRLNRARADFDHPHSFNTSFVYTLPVGHNRRFLGNSSRLVDSLLGGWDLGVLNYWQSGSTFTVYSGRYTGPNSGSYSFMDYAGDRNIGTLDRGNNVAAGRSTGVYYFTDAQKAAFTYPNVGETGNSGRNAFRGPRNFNVDMTLSKRFKLAERKVVVFRAEAYNAFNNANFGTPGASFVTPQSVGKFSGTVNTARVVQAALRFEF